MQDALWCRPNAAPPPAAATMALQAPPTMAHLLNILLAILLSSIFITMMGKSTFVFWRNFCRQYDINLGSIIFWPGTLTCAGCRAAALALECGKFKFIEPVPMCHQLINNIQEWQLRQNCQWQWTQACQLLGLGTDRHNRPGQAGDSEKNLSFSLPGQAIVWFKTWIERYGIFKTIQQILKYQGLLGNDNFFFHYAEFGDIFSRYDQPHLFRNYLLNFNLRIQNHESQCEVLCQNYFQSY